MIAQPLTIGPVTLGSNILLAPVANYCDLAFRLCVRSFGGVGMASTDLLSPHGLLRGTARSLDLAQTNDADRPVAMQLYGCDPDVLAQGARWAVEHGATVVDINMGCPVDKVAKKNGGSLLLCDVPATVALTQRVVRAVEAASAGRVPVTAKMPLGWDEARLVSPDLARRLEEIGVAAVTVHGRTTEMMFRGKVRLDGIARVVECVRTIPVIGNGDILTPGDALRMLRETGCAGVMVGRGAFSAPWLPRDIWAAQTAGGAPPEPTEAEKIAAIRRYLDDMIRFRDERYAMIHVRRRIAWFGKRLGPCKPLREAVRLAQGPAEVHRALDEFSAGGLRYYPRGAGASEGDDRVLDASPEAMEAAA